MTLTDQLAYYALVQTIVALDKAINSAEYLWENPHIAVFLLLVLAGGCYGVQQIITNSNLSQQSGNELPEAEKNIYEINLEKAGFQGPYPKWVLDEYTNDVMVDPVIVVLSNDDTTTLDRTTVENIFQTAKNEEKEACCPITGKRICSCVGDDNLKSAIKDWVEQTIADLQVKQAKPETTVSLDTKPPTGASLQWHRMWAPVNNNPAHTEPSTQPAPANPFSQHLQPTKRV